MTLSEGIEEEGQRDALRALRCTYSRPVPADEIDSMLVSANVA